MLQVPVQDRSDTGALAAEIENLGQFLVNRWDRTVRQVVQPKVS